MRLNHVSRNVCARIVKKLSNTRLHIDEVQPQVARNLRKHDDSSQVSASEHTASRQSVRGVRDPEGTLEGEPGRVPNIRS